MENPTTTNSNLDSDPTSFLLPDDILITIFSKLSVKTLLCLRCVSKSWHHLISSAFSDYKHCLPSPMCGLFHGHNNTIKFTSLQSRTYVNPLTIDVALSFLPSSVLHDPGLCLYDCCNGLLLLGSDELYICNPATQQWAKIPERPITWLQSGYVNLIADPHCSPSYKIYSFLYNEADLSMLMEIQVFSSKTGRWSTYLFPRWLECNFCCYGLAFLNGRIYVLHDWSKFILEVDVERDFCRRICGPVEVGIVTCLGHCRGLLHVATILDEDLVVWALENEQSDKYVLKHYAYDIVHWLQLPDADENWMITLTFHPDLDVIFLRTPERLFAYDFLHRKLEEMSKAGDLERYGWSLAYSPCYSKALDGM